MPSTLNKKDYSVAWLAPLYFEAGAALAMLDEYHGVPKRSPGQTVQYHLGRMGQHNVVIAGFPAGEVGIGVAASIATEVKRDFPNLQVGLLVGIAAGIPSPKNDIRLGDVVIAVPTGDKSGVIGYDLIRMEPERISLKQWQNATHDGLGSVITHLMARSIVPEGGCFQKDSFVSHMERFQRTLFQRPSTPPPTEFSPHVTRPSGDNPIAHYGCILSGNRVIKCAAIRDEMTKAYNAIAIEMEAAGIMNRLPVAVIRGVSDFADAQKNDEWQFYAAASAAAYAKELILCLSPLQTENEPSANPAPQTRMSQALLNLSLDEKLRHMTGNLDWRNSVKDLLKVLNLDSSLEARARLARRWNVFVGKDGDAVRNIALHGLIMDEIAKNEGNASASLAAALSLHGSVTAAE